MLTTEQLWTEEINGVMAPKFDPTELRLSESNGCARKRVLTALEVSPTHADKHHNNGVLYAGHAMEDRVVEAYKRKYEVVTQREIDLPQYGATGHMDLWVPALPLIVECKSTSIDKLHDLPMESHVKQLQAYLHFDGRHNGCLRGELAYTFRETWDMKVFPVEYNPEVGRQIEEELANLHARITAGSTLLDTGVSLEDLLQMSAIIPPVPEGMTPFAFPCKFTTKQGVEVFCPHFGRCHTGTNWTPAPEIIDLAEPLADLKAAKERHKAAKDKADQAKAIVDGLELVVHQAMDGQKLNEARAGEVSFKRTWSKGSTTYDWKAATLAGLITGETMAKMEAYKKIGAGHWRVTVK